MILPEGLVQEFRTVALERLARAETAWATVLTTLDDESVALIHREIHTLKGESCMVGFQDVNMVCHKLEDLLEVARTRGYAVDEDFDLAVNMALRFMAMLVRKKVGSQLAGIDLPGFIRQIDRVLSEVRGEVTPRAQRQPLQAVDANRCSAAVRAQLAPIAVDVFLEYAAARGMRRNRLRSSWHAMRDLVGIHRALIGRGQLAKHEQWARGLAKDLRKQIDIKLDVASAEVTTEVLAALDVATLHLVRNAIDHGIELPADRVAAGKPPNGTVVIRGRVTDDVFELVVEDDGAGIAFEEVRRRATELGLSPPEDADSQRWVDVLCHSGLSTRKTASDVSGRGVGLDAVRASVVEVAGRVSLASKRGVGTTWTITIPVTPFQVEGSLLWVRDLPCPIVIGEGWQPFGVAEGSTVRIDLAVMLGLATEPANRKNLTWFSKGSSALGLSCEQPPTPVQARKLVVTPRSTLAEIVTIDGTEGLLVRPEQLLATRNS